MNVKHETTRVDIDRLAAQFLRMFPDLTPDSRRTAVQLYRLLGKGEPVSREELAEAAALPVERVNATLAGWNGVYYDGERIIGFWGLTPKPFSKHVLKIDGRTGYAWCAWDTLFLPEILGMPLEIESTDPETEQIVRLRVAPDGVADLSPSEAVMSILEPGEEMAQDVVAKFCHFVHFFPSAEVGQRWVDKHPGTSLMSIADAFALGKKRNARQFKEALAVPAPTPSASGPPPRPASPSCARRPSGIPR